MSDHPPLPPGFVLEDQRKADIANAVDSLRPQADAEAGGPLSFEVTDDSEAQPQSTDVSALPPGFVAEGDQPLVKPDTLSGLYPEQLKSIFDSLPDAMKAKIAIDAPWVMARHGFTAGLDTEVPGIAAALKQLVLHPIDAIESRGGSIADAYHQGRRDALALIDLYHQDSPVMSRVAEIGGAVANPLGLEAKGLMGLAKVGAMYGGVSGFEDDDGSLGERLVSAAEHLGIGAVAAPAIGAAVKTPGAIKNMLPSNRTESELTEAFDRQGVDPLAPYVGGTGAQMASGVTHMTLGGIPLSEAAQRTVQQARAARDRIASAMGWVKDVMGAGRAAQKGSEAFVEASGNKADSLYRAMPIPAERPALLGGTKQALADVNAGLPSNPELSKLLEDPRLKGFQSAIEGTTEDVPTGLLDASGNPIMRPVQKGGGLSWADMQAFRSYIGEKMNGLAFQSDTSQKALSRLYAGLSQDMEATARAEGPKALAAFRRANTYYRARQARIQNVIEPILGSKGDAGPQAAFNQIQSWASNKGETVRLGQLLRSMPEDEAATVRATVFSRLGNAKAGQQNWEGDEFSPATFATMWHNMDPAARVALFPGKQYRQDIEDILKITHAMRDSAKYANNSKTALGANAFSHISGLMASIPFTLASAAAEFGAGKLLAYPKFARWLASVPKKPNAPALLAHIRRLNSVAAAQPAIANEVHILQERLAQFFTNPSTPLAAQDENKP